MIDKRLPSYPLATIKTAFSAAETLNRTYSAMQGAERLGFDDAALIAVIQNLTHGDFYKSMTAYHDNRLWQDVYKPTVGGRIIYVKVTQNAQNELLLISFKEAER